MNFTDFYEVLGVGKEADASTIKSAYRKLARKHHPDLNPGNEKAEAKFQEINNAYEVLKDEQERLKYDELYDYIKAGGKARVRPESNRANQHFSQEDIDEILSNTDFFEQLFGEGRRHARATPKRGQDIHAGVELELEEVLEGSSRSLSLQREETCSECGGHGHLRGTVCTRCRGLGRVVATSTLEVKLQKGLTEGSVVRLKGQGEAGQIGAPRGDLLLKVHLKPKPGWNVEGYDLHTDLHVSIFEAILGGEVELATLAGKIELKIPPGSQNHKVMRLRGQGLPRMGGAKAGDLYVRIVLQIPTKLDERQKQQLRSLRDDIRLTESKK